MWDLSVALLPWLALFVSLASPCFAGLVWRINREKLRFDLFNRRFEILSCALDCYFTFLGWKPTDLEKAHQSLEDSPKLDEGLKGLLKASVEATFLFKDPGIANQLEAMHSGMLQVIGNKRDVFPISSAYGDEALRIYEQQSTELKKVHTSVSELRTRMLRPLKFHRL
jgi:hypothetical protein